MPEICLIQYCLFLICENITDHSGYVSDCQHYKQCFTDILITILHILQGDMRGTRKW